MTLLRRAVVAFLALKLVNLAVNVLTFPVLSGARRATGAVPATSAGPGSRVGSARRSVAVLVPMRNEAHRLADTLPSILAQRADELILLDDCSTDATLQLATTLSGVADAVVVEGAPTPPGWTGKTWACDQLARRTQCDVLVFCDADVLLAPGAVQALMTEMDRQRADLLSVFPRQQTDTLGEQLLVPLVDDVLLCFLPFPLLRADVPSAATANGSVMAFDRESYERLGGFAAVRRAVVEDVAMARLVRRQGMRLGLVLGGRLVRTRMYSDYAGCVDGFGRGLLPVAGGSRLALVTGAVWHLVAYTLPAVLCPRQPRWAVPVLLAVGERLLVEAKTGRRQWRQAVLPPLSPVAALPVVARALRRTQVWKGRSYGRGVDAGVPAVRERAA
jgi:hypothetical protein